MKKKNVVEDAVVKGKVLRENETVINQVSDLIGEVDNLSDIYSNAGKSKSIIDVLVGGNIISAQEKQEWIKDDGTMSDIGKRKFENILSGIVLGEQAVRALNNPDYALGNVRRNIAYSIVELIKNNSLGEDFSMNGNINRGIELLSRAKVAKCKSVDEMLAWATTPDLFDGSRPIDEFEAEDLMAALWMSEGQRKFKAIVKSYNDRALLAAQGQGALFGGAPTKDKLVDELTKSLNYDTERIRKQFGKASNESPTDVGSNEGYAEQGHPGEEVGERGLTAPTAELAAKSAGNAKAEAEGAKAEEQRTEEPKAESEEDRKKREREAKKEAENGKETVGGDGGKDVDTVSESAAKFTSEPMEYEAFEKLNEQRMKDIESEYEEVENQMSALYEEGKGDSEEYKELEDRLDTLNEEYIGLKRINAVSKKLHASKGDVVDSGMLETSDGKNRAWVQLSLDFDGEAPVAEKKGTKVENSVGNKNDESGGDLTDLRLRKLQPGEKCNVERRYEENGSFNFVGNEKITSPDDVAYIFKSLEDSAIENTFVVLVKDGRGTIIHTGMGNMTSSMVDIIAARSAVDNIHPDALFFVHNHPSGKLDPSNDDRNTYSKLKEIYGDIVKPGIIIDQKSGKYAVFEHDGDGVKVRPNSSASEVPYKVFSFSKFVFSEDYNFDEATRITDASDVASFVSSQRLGDGNKVGVLIMLTSA